MIETPWGSLAVADAHIHFFSHRFFSALLSIQYRRQVGEGFNDDIGRVDPRRQFGAPVR